MTCGNLQQSSLKTTTWYHVPECKVKVPQWTATVLEHSSRNGANPLHILAGKAELKTPSHVYVNSLATFGSWSTCTVRHKSQVCGRTKEEHTCCPSSSKPSKPSRASSHDTASWNSMKARPLGLFVWKSFGMYTSRTSPYFSASALRSSALHSPNSSC